LAENQATQSLYVSKAPSTSGELGKQLAERIIPELKSEGETTLSHDSSPTT
jgi:hypothetical protein